MRRKRDRSCLSFPRWATTRAITQTTRDFRELEAKGALPRRVFVERCMPQDSTVAPLKKGTKPVLRQSTWVLFEESIPKLARTGLPDLGVLTLPK